MDNNYQPPSTPAELVVGFLIALIMLLSLFYIGFVLQKRVLGIYDLEKRVEILELHSNKDRSN